MRHEPKPFADQSANTASDTVGWIEVAKYKDKTVVIYGTFTATVQVQGKVVKGAKDSGPLDIGSAKTAAGYVEVTAAMTHLRLKVTGLSAGTVKGLFAGFNSGTR